MFQEKALYNQYWKMPRPKASLVSKHEEEGLKQKVKETPDEPREYFGNSEPCPLLGSSFQKKQLQKQQVYLSTFSLVLLYTPIPLLG